METFHSHSHHAAGTCILSTFVGQLQKKMSLMLVSFQHVLAHSHCVTLSFTPLVPTQPLIIMTIIIYANVIRPRNMIAVHSAPMEIYH